MFKKKFEKKMFGDKRCKVKKCKNTLNFKGTPLQK